MIYGDDNRIEVFQANAKMQELADSTVALIDSNKVVDVGSGLVKVVAIPASSEFKLCKGERFASQLAGAPCSGVLVTPNIVLTAGHCVKAETCDGAKILFGYSYNTPDQNMNFFPVKDLYSCKKVISRVFESNGLDYALMEIDRSVVDHKPAVISEKAPVVKDPMVVIGHPMFLPTKIAGGAVVRSVSDTFFVANTDTYAGSSGSAVFNEKTGTLAGILVRGEVDFAKTEAGCNISKVCKNDECRGEDITRIDMIKSHLPQ